MRTRRELLTGVLGLGVVGLVAACDLDKRPLQQAVDTINKNYGNTDCKAYHDYREMMGRDDLDAVMRTCRETKGTSAIVFVQTCAAEKRRRRKRGLMEDPVYPFEQWRELDVEQVPFNEGKTLP